MMKKRFLIAFILLLTTSSASYANWFLDIINAINKQSGITHNLLGNLYAQESQMLGCQEDIDSLMKQLNHNVTGNSGWGTYQFHDYQSYGNDAGNWSQVMQMAQGGQGSGALGQTMNDMANQFPADTHTYNQGVHNPNSQTYYALKSQTILAIRAASELDYNKIQEQIAYQQMLQQQIEKTKDLKAAMDLSNRIQVEGNLIHLEILRQAALANQQQAIKEQASVNDALMNARFLIKPTNQTKN